eukprot:TRINITY_DN20741_c0_g2_i1.p1 TRINITY_DN20741_c0_g2~~TRINITY_DN20741_c0_g2_i1.p1  ORF type:complete len:627 (+),score=105.08 TRINITY_DN20741_c0_g2_i1:98-1978(+)
MAARLPPSRALTKGFTLDKGKAKPLLRFDESGPSLEPAGLDHIARINNVVLSVALLGDTKSEKSLLATRLVSDTPKSLASSASNPPAFSVGAPTSTVIKETKKDGIDVSSVRITGTDRSLLVLECEVSSPEDLTRRQFVRDIVMAMSSIIVFVQRKKITNESLEYLAQFSSVNQRLKCGESCGMELVERLYYVVGSSDATLSDYALETELKMNPKGQSEAEMKVRRDISSTFPDRHFLCLSQTDDGKSLETFKADIFQLATPLRVSGVELNGKLVAKLLEALFRACLGSREVHCKELVELVIDDVLNPIVMKLIAGAVKAGLPTKMSDYDPAFADKCPLQATLQEFDETTRMVTETSIVGKYRSALEREIRKLWQQLLAKNEALGDKIIDTTTEEREVEDECKFVELGGKSMFSKMTYINRIVRVETRTAQHVRRGGVPKCSAWKATGRRQKKADKQLLDHLMSLPIKSGRVWIQMKNGKTEESYLVLRDFHLLIWRGKPEDRLPDEQFNFWDNQVTVEEVDSCHYTFHIKVRHETVVLEDIVVQLNQAQESPLGIFAIVCCGRTTVPEPRPGVQGAVPSPWEQIRKGWVECIETHARYAPKFIDTFPSAVESVEIPRFSVAIPTW